MSPFHYAYKTISQMFQFIVKNGICYLHFLQRNMPFDHKAPPNEVRMLNLESHKCTQSVEKNIETSISSMFFEAF